MRTLITGGSGFIGTNMVEYYVQKGYEVINIDLKCPKQLEYKDLWTKCDIRDYNHLFKTVKEFHPDFLIHLAASTGLTGKTLDDYSSNTLGVENILKVSKEIESINKTIFTSSMLVCKAGYYPSNDEDYCPTTLYGESKVIGEKTVRRYKSDCRWTIIRPTSIWGPWFGRTYRDFFDLIMRNRYFNFTGKMSTKTYGYIGNVIYQIDSILTNQLSDGKTLYVGDYSPTRVDEWAKEIAQLTGSHVYTIPRIFVRLAAYLGDFAGILKLRFPMNSFRYKNMTTDNVLDLSATQLFAPDTKFTRNEGNTLTIEWMRQYHKK